MQLRKLIPAAILLTIGSGCACVSNNVPPAPLSVPARPRLNHITDAENAELKKTFPELQRKLVENDKLLKVHIKALEAVLKSTQKK